MAYHRFLILLIPLLPWVLLGFAGCATVSPSSSPSLTPFNLGLEHRAAGKQKLDSMFDGSLHVAGIGYQILQSLPERGMGENEVARLPFLYTDFSPALKNIYFGEPVLGNSNSLFVIGPVPGFVGGIDIQRGDEILEVNGSPVRSEAAMDLALQEVVALREIKIRIKRDSQEKEALVPLLRFEKKLTFLVIDHYEANAFTDGKVVAVLTGMLDFVKNDDELALMLAHEIGHVMKGHLGSAWGEKAEAWVTGIITGALMESLTGVDAASTAQETASNVMMSFSREDEAEADQAALNYVTKAGFNPQKAVQIWERLAGIQEGGIGHAFSTTHPSHPERVKNALTQMDELKKEQLAKKKRLQALMQKPPPGEEQSTATVAPQGSVSSKRSPTISESGFARRIHMSIWKGGRPIDVGESFPPDSGKIFWFAKFKYRGWFTDLFSGKLRIEWYAPNNRLYHEEIFKISDDPSFACVALELDRELGDRALGQWRVRVWKKDKLIDERGFRIVK